MSAFRSRFHGRLRRHHEDADAFADALAELCRVGYPQSPPELRQELIAEQFVRGQSDPELKKYLWVVVIRTQKDKKLQTLIEVCTDFSSLSTPHIYTGRLNRPSPYISKWRHLYHVRRSVMIRRGPTKHRNTPKYTGIHRNTPEYTGIHRNTRTYIPNN